MPHAKNKANNSCCSFQGNKGDRAFHFPAMPNPTASLRISFSWVLRPTAASRYLMQLSAMTMSGAGAMGSFVPMPTTMPSENVFIHRNNCIAAMPASRPTCETVNLDSAVYSTWVNFSSDDRRRRNCIQVLNSTRSLSPPKLISVFEGLFLLRSLRKTEGAENQEDTSLTELISVVAGLLLSRSLRKV